MSQMTRHNRNGHANIVRTRIFPPRWNAPCAKAKNRFSTKTYFGKWKLTSTCMYKHSSLRAAYSIIDKKKQFFLFQYEISSFIRSLSPSQQILPNETIESSSLSLSQTNLSACGPSTKQESPKNKWPCSSCTYLNQMKLSRCAQCSSKRESSSNNVNIHGGVSGSGANEATNLPEQIKALSIRGSDPELNASLCRTSPMGSTNSLYGSRTNLGAVGARNSPVEQKPYCTGKWTCAVCYRSIQMH